MKLKDCVAIVTAAGSGIGRASARLFAEEGAKVMVTDIDQATGQETVELIKDAGGEATFLRVDVARVAELKNMIKQTVDTYGKLDILFNNAGIPGPAGFDISEEQYDKAMDVLLKGAFFATKFAVPVMRKSGGGNILYTSSTSSIRPSPRSVVYSIGKAAMNHMTRNFAVMLGKDNIRVNCLCPGTVDTPMMSEFAGLPRGQKIPSERLEMAAKSYPLGRLGQPEDMAKAALFLVSDDSSYITGQPVVVDGGMSLIS
ncbi:SDR family NAD(P)-dependent oxidoreductase [Chloroflexota bacterium]